MSTDMIYWNPVILNWSYHSPLQFTWS